MVLAELDKMDADDERYAAKMHVVRESVEMHIAEEEAKLLPRLERLLDKEQAQALTEAMRLMKGGGAHPSASPGTGRAPRQRVRRDARQGERRRQGPRP